MMQHFALRILFLFVSVIQTASWAHGQVVPDFVRNQFEKLLPLGDGPSGKCQQRAQLWQQQIYTHSKGTAYAGNFVVYFSEKLPSAIGNWVFHIAPTITYEGQPWVLEKSPYMNGIFTPEQWIAKLLKSASKCVPVNWSDLSSQFFQDFKRNPYGKVEVSAKNECYTSYFSKEVTDPYAFIPQSGYQTAAGMHSDPASEANLSPLERSYEFFIKQCHEVIGVKLYESPRASEQVEPVEIEGAREQADQLCREYFPQATFNPELFGF